jgi:hypothetical protein
MEVASLVSRMLRETFQDLVRLWEQKYASIYISDTSESISEET